MAASRHSRANRNRSPTPPPLIEAFQDEDGDPRSWYWEDHGGGMELSFGMFKCRKMNEVGLPYLLWCRKNWCPNHPISVSEESNVLQTSYALVAQKRFRDAFDYYHAGLEGLIEDEYNRFRVPFGTRHRGKTIRQCQDKQWLLWACKQSQLTQKVNESRLYPFGEGLNK
jgi:hypothetical protein